MMDFGEFGNSIGRCTTPETVCTRENLYNALTVENKEELATRLTILQDQAVKKAGMSTEDFISWENAEIEKYNADPEHYIDAGPRLRLESIIEAVTLQIKQLPPLKFIVENIIPFGTVLILASPPKFGKSYMMICLALAIASGGRFLGYRTTKTEVLYLALEDSERRLQDRMNQILQGKPAPAGVTFATTCYDLDNGLLAQLEDFMNHHPDTGLIIIDTLQMVRGSVHGREGAYAGDYREISTLKKFAGDHGVAIILVHHLRKMGDADPFNMISGTNGIAGAADEMLVLTKEKRNSDTATMHITGRDVEQMELVLQFDKKTYQWQNLGDVEAYEAQQAIENYEHDPIVKTIRKLLAQDPTGWEGSAQDLMTAGRMLTGTTLASTNRELAEKLKGLDRWLFEVDHIDHQRKKNGSGGGKHIFTKAREVAA